MNDCMNISAVQNCSHVFFCPDSDLFSQNLSLNDEMINPRPGRYPRYVARWTVVMQ